MASNANGDAAFEVGKALSLSAVASTWMVSGQVQAATELAQLAATDNRLATISLLFIPALGWVAFNIIPPLFNQLNRMGELAEDAKGSAPKPTKGKKKRGFATAVGLGAALSLAAAQQADAATELSQLAASDNRLGTISLLFIPAIGWVGFNILQPLFNQLNRMGELAEDAKGSVSKPKKATSKAKRGIAGAAVGLGAALSLAAAQQADAATELSQLAASDNRLGTISLLFIPAIGWVGFNILQPLFNQLNRMGELAEDAKGSVSKPKKATSKAKRGIAGAAVGLGAALSMAVAQQADAATELSQLAASDNRLGTISLLFVPAIGWVGFNILQPLFNQLNRMGELAEDAKGASAKPARRR